MDNRTLMDFVRINERKVKGISREDVLKTLGEFLLNEYETELDTSKLNDIGVCYTTIGGENEDEHEMQITLNMSSLPATLSVYIDGATGGDYICRDSYPTWESLYEDMEYWNFDGLYGWGLEMYREYEDLTKGEL